MLYSPQKSQEGVDYRLKGDPWGLNPPYVLPAFESYVRAMDESSRWYYVWFVRFAIQRKEALFEAFSDIPERAKLLRMKRALKRIEEELRDKVEASEVEAILDDYDAEMSYSGFLVR